MAVYGSEDLLVPVPTTLTHFGSEDLHALAMLNPIRFGEEVIESQAFFNPIRFGGEAVDLTLFIQPPRYADAILDASVEYGALGIRGQQVEQGADGMATDNFAPGALAASIRGNDIMESAFFDTEATFSAKVAAAVINGDRLKAGSLLTAKLAVITLLAKIADGSFSADAAGRAKMAAAFFGDETTFSAKVATAVISGDRFVNTSISAGKIQNGVLTLAKFLSTGIKSFTSLGRVGAGTITLTGAAVGDRVVAVWRTDGVTLEAGPLFAATITAANLISQVSTANLSAQRFSFWLWPAAA